MIYRCVLTDVIRPKFWPRRWSDTSNLMVNRLNNWRQQVNLKPYHNEMNRRGLWNNIAVVYQGMMKVCDWKLSDFMGCLNWVLSRSRSRPSLRNKHIGLIRPDRPSDKMWDGADGKTLAILWNRLSAGTVQWSQWPQLVERMVPLMLLVWLAVLSHCSKGVSLWWSEGLLMVSVASSNS